MTGNGWPRRRERGNALIAALAGHEQPRLGDDLIKRPTGRSLESALPNHENTPAEVMKGLGGARVAFYVGRNLCGPERLARLGHLEERATVAVPEATIDLNDGPVLREHDVRLPGEIPDMEAETQPGRVKGPTQRKFWFGVGAANPAHVEPSLRCGQNIHTTARQSLRRQ
jgi:hypothetical protein